MGEVRTEPLFQHKEQPLTPVLLVARNGGEELARFPFAEGTATVGSSAEADLKIDDSTVSRVHAELQLVSGGVRVKDGGSTNGTRYQGAKVTEAIVPIGASIRLGRVDVYVLPLDARPLRELGRLRTASPKMAKALEALSVAAKSETTVLIEGETGTGKDIAARTVHEHSALKRGPLEIVDCGSLPRELAGSELFGHVRGAFTGADRDKIGAFERAKGGTLFLDEIGELPLELQPLLLRALEAREIRPVGGAAFKKVQVRVIAATNRSLDAEVAAGRFRKDLLHRLTVLRVVLPPLRERREDLFALALDLTEGLGERARGFTLSADTIKALESYAWPGNVRELKNLIERAVALSADGAVDAQRLGLLGPGEAGGQAQDYQEARKQALDAFEHDFIVTLLRRCDRNVAQAA